VGSLSLVRALQIDPATSMREATEPDPVHARPNDDLIEVTRLMADFKLLTLPVIDDHHRILGIITVDDRTRSSDPRRLAPPRTPTPS